MDISSKESLTTKDPKIWELGDELDLISNSNLKFQKDLSQRHLKPIGNYLIVNYKHQFFKIVHFDEDMALQNVYHFQVPIAFNFHAVRFRDQTIYGLEENRMVAISFPKGFDKKPRYKVYNYRDSYTDFIINHKGLFFWLQVSLNDKKGSESILLVSTGPDLEHELKAATPGTFFMFAKFQYTSYSNFVIRTHPDERENFRFYALNMETSDIQKAIRTRRLPQGRAGLRIKQLFETKNLVYYVYFKGRHTEKIVGYVKGETVNPALMNNRIKGLFVAFITGYHNSLEENFILVSNLGNKQEAHLKLYSLNLTNSYVTCQPSEGEIGRNRKEICQFRVATENNIYNFKLCFGRKCSLNLKRVDNGESRDDRVLKKYDLAVLIFAFVFSIFVLCLCRWYTKKNMEAIEQAQDIIQRPGGADDRISQVHTESGISNLGSEISLSELNTISNKNPKKQIIEPRSDSEMDSSARRSSTKSAMNSQVLPVDLGVGDDDRFT